MALNLHNIVRPAINAVNPEYLGVWRRSSGFTTAANGDQVPTYVDTSNVRMQVQALSGRELEHKDFLNMQGVKRVVYCFGDVRGVVRPDVKGGDILQFPETRGGANRDWLVTHVLETWTPDGTGFCKLGVILQQ